ncbi:MAG: heavy metal translocating P-type ATPase [Terriglobales bacterium]
MKTHENLAGKPKDPVCGMTVDPMTASSSEYKGETYYFCRRKCKRKFEADPQKYLVRAAAATAGPVVAVESHQEAAAESQPTAAAALIPSAVIPNPLVTIGARVEDQPAPVMVVDPVCGMTIDPATAAGSTEHEGHTYYFCNPSCKTKFEAEPEKYLRPEAGSAAEVPSEMMPAEPAAPGVMYVCPMDPEVRQDYPGACPKCGMALEPEMPVAASAERTEYTCPMHPEIVRDAPGACPICGMALEPRTVAAVEGEDPELLDMTRRFKVSLALTVPVFVLAMGEMLPGTPFQGRAYAWLQFVLASQVVLWGGLPFFQRGGASVINRHLNMFSLIALGTGAAYVYSVVALLVPGLLPDGARHHSQPSLYFEAAAVIITLVLLGQVLELRARKQTGSAIRALLGLSPKTARRLLEGGAEEDISIDQVQAGDRLLIRPGEKIPVDGIVLDGASSVDEAMITGESMPTDKAANDKVIGGTINTTGSLTMKAERVGSETLLAQMIQMVAEAQRSRAPIQKLADQVSGIFVPVVIAVSILTFIAWFVWGPEPRLAHAVVNAVAVLIIACPCALGLATPMAIMVGTGKGASVGVLVKNAEALEAMEKVTTLVVDKTGTLTEGKPKVVTLVHAPDITEDELLRIAASLERHSEHPLAQAVVNEAKARGIALRDVQDFQSVTAQGVTGKLDGKATVVGKKAMIQGTGAQGSGALMRQFSSTIFGNKEMEMISSGQTVLYVGHGSNAAGMIGIADTVKASTLEALQQLRAEGVKVVMLTGDSKTTATSVARNLGIEQFESEVLPERKVEVVQRLQKAGEIVAMAGDGVNDAPALAQADVGIAMGTGTDVAMQSAAVTLVKGDLRGIARARRLSRATMRNIRQNLFFAFIYNALGVPIAAGVLYPFFGLLLSPMIAAAAMSLSSVSVIGNSLRLRRLKL